MISFLAYSAFANSCAQRKGRSVQFPSANKVGGGGVSHHLFAEKLQHLPSKHPAENLMA